MTTKFEKGTIVRWSERGAIKEGPITEVKYHTLCVKPYGYDNTEEVPKKNVIETGLTPSSNAEGSPTPEHTSAREITIEPVSSLDEEPTEEVEEDEQEIRLKFDLTKYKRTEDVRTKAGRASLDNDDSVAQYLRGKDLENLYGFVSKHVSTLRDSEIPVDQLKDRYKHLNPGMQRMNLGNLLRGAMSSVGITSLEDLGEQE